MAETRLPGLRTVIYAAPDLAVVNAWYADVLGIDPYFDQPFYVGFSVGGYELGLVPDTEPTVVSNADTLTYWGVSDIGAVMTHWLDRGATVHTAVQGVGDGIKTAAVKDPFGNVVGFIENPHFSL
ncbi:VOC family protein [Spirosoma spitsbergense]|uniref:VOC family protein n=1 Tax=Spirosoma spitsbergense TaxID=431554 RepID=UPI00037F1DE9|nr:VOC family protein [Spirosoma spitsbergense]